MSTVKLSNISGNYVDKLARLVRAERKDWRSLTVEEVIDKALYHYGGTVAEALIDALLNK